MYKYILFLWLLCVSNTWATSNPYFQQEVNYKIEVKLHDKEHTLHAAESIEYINHSTDTLTFIYFHLWPNAYQKNSALDEQLIREGSFKLHYAKEKDKGYIDSLSFSSDGKKLEWSFDEKHHDICKVILASPLAPGMKVNIATPFHVKLPNAKISRLGHLDQFYAITQWYPKPAVYDNEGWHAMPYLNQGEFYSEFGSYDVSITLPENYVVGATGDLQTESEIVFLNTKSNDTASASKDLKKVNAFPASSEKYKTIRYTQQRVHDFGWFADKRYIVRKSEVVLPHTKQVVNTYALFTPQNKKAWKHATQYINDAVYYYSLWNGDYPYKNCTAVDGTISAGGGMEYPNVTIIGNTSDTFLLDVVITHEVGHNWFYGILGSNEREHAWMDEGINSYNELRYIKTKYPKAKAVNAISSSKITQGIIGLKKLPHHFYYTYSYLIAALYNSDQALEQSSENFTGANYGLMVYDKSAAAFNMLHQYLGTAVFDSCMHTYYENWKFKHPAPNDIRKVFEDITHKELSWFFDDVIKTTKKNDYQVKKVRYDEGTQRYTVQLKNNQQLETPIQLTAVDDDNNSESFTLFPKDSNGVYHIKTKLNVHKFVLDSGLNSLDINQFNNQFILNTPFHRSRLPVLHFFPHAGSVTRKELYIIPVLGVNTAQGFMPGVSISNGIFPAKKFNWNTTIAYGNFNIMLNRNWHPDKIFKRISIGASARYLRTLESQYKMAYYFGEDEIYDVLIPQLFTELVYKTKQNSFYQGGLNIKRINLAIQSLLGVDVLYQITSQNNFKFKKSEHSLQARFEHFLTAYTPSSFNGKNTTFDKMNVELKSKFRLDKSHFIKTRIFAGTFFNYTNYMSNPTGLMSYYGYSFWGNNDYTYSDTYISRNYDSHQTYINDGGVRNRFFNYLGGVNNMLAFNSSIDVLANGLVSVYYDVAYSKTKYALNNTLYGWISREEVESYTKTYSNYAKPIFYMAAGVRIAIIPEYVEFYVPLFLHETMQGTRAFKDTYKNIGILFNLTKMNPFEASRKAYD